MQDFTIKNWKTGKTEVIPAKDSYNAVEIYAKRHGNCVVIVQGTGNWLIYDCQELFGYYSIVCIGVHHEKQ